MTKKISIFGQSISILAVIFAIIITALLLTLGTWQLKRLDEKEHFIKTIITNVASSAHLIDSFDEATPLNYSKISVSGEFLADKNIFLYGRRSSSTEKDGYYLLSAFQATNGKIYLVSRGWLPQSVKRQFNNMTTDTVQDDIEAIVMSGEKRGFMVPKNDINQQIWFTIDLELAKSVLGISEDSFYLMQIQSTTLPNGGMPLSTQHLHQVRNDHLEYAITWYSLAIIFLIIFYIYHKRYKSL